LSKKKLCKKLQNHLTMQVVALNNCSFDEANLVDHRRSHRTLNLHEYYKLFKRV